MTQRRNFLLFNGLALVVLVWLDTMHIFIEIRSTKKEALSYIPDAVSAGISTHTIKVISSSPGGSSAAKSEKTQGSDTINKAETTVFDKDDGVAIFYNLYLPPGDKKAVRHVLHNIVEEQFKQVGESAAAGFPVYYNTIGERIKTEQFTPACKRHNLTCIHLRHYDQAFEMVTLEEVLQYCRQKPRNRVIYLHPKGSFHPSASQNRWRKAMTAASTSKSCVSPPDDKCNVCGRTFVSSWGPVFAGNMFAAKCSYVQKLVSPLDLERLMKKVYDTRPGNVTFTLFDMRYEYSLAQGRMAAEYFIGTHPDLVPCEGYTDGSFSMVPKRRFPRTAMSYINRTAYKELMETGRSFNEFFLLPGLLWRWHVMYNSTPPDSSWFWTHFPDGMKWRDAVHEFQGVPGALKALMQ